MWRSYRMEIWPDLLGGALLMRQWGRIGTEGRRRLDPYPDVGAALNALAAIERAKWRRGMWIEEGEPRQMIMRMRCAAAVTADATLQRGH